MAWNHLQGLTIEKIDLSLVIGKYKGESFDMEKIKLCEGIVLPILYSIVEGGSSMLRHIQLPVKWRNGKSTELTRFMEVYNNYLRDLARPCQHEWEEDGVQKKCENECGMGMHTWIGEPEERYGIQTATCSECMKNFCSETRCIAGFDYCPECQRYHCKDCSIVYDCFGDGCHKTSCEDCNEVVLCSLCSDSYCSSCKFIGICGDCYQAVCDDCGLKYCSNCKEFFCDDCRDVTTCDSCDEEVCSDCIKLLGNNGVSVCEGCYLEE